MSTSAHGDSPGAQPEASDAHEAPTLRPPSRGGVGGYAVFARHDREPQLHHIGEVQAADDDEAVVFAYTLYDERRWQEMFVVRESALVTLIRPE